MFKAVISVMGKDQKGVVARFATYVAERGINIEDIQQQVVHGQFIMDMLVDLSDLSVSLDELITGVLALGKSIDMEVRVALHDQQRRKRIAVLVSKEPHCLAHLLEEIQSGRLHGDVQAVLSNHPELESLARASELTYAWKSAAGEQKAPHQVWLEEKLKALDPDLIVLARYMQVLSPSIVQAFRNKIINIHPSLLPYFPGANAYEQAWKSGLRVSGCTAHFVTETLDEGPVILQDVFHIDVGKDDAQDVKRKGQVLEAQVLAQAVQMFLDEKLVVVNGKVVFKPGISRFLNQNNPGQS